MFHSSVQRASLSRHKVGIITSASGFVTVERPHNIVFQAVAKDAVYYDDKIATGPSASATITFKDGNAILLRANSSIALTGPVCDREGTMGGSLLAPPAQSSPEREVTARPGRDKVRGFGLRMLSLAVIAYTMLRDLQQADALTTDDDTITPRDSEHGAFEVITKSGTSFVVDDPGLTYLVDNSGTVERRVNSASRMEELQVAQQSVLGTLSQGFAGAPGSSSPHDAPIGSDAQPLAIPINFTVPGTVLDRFEPVFTPPIEDRPVIIPPPPPPPPPHIDAFTFDSGISGDRITNNNNVTLLGTATPNSTVSIFDGSVPIGTTTADAKGNWTFETGPLSDGEHAFAVTAGGPVQNTANTFARASFASLAATTTAAPTSDAYVIVIDTQPPASPTIVSAHLSDGQPDNGDGGSTLALTIEAEAGSTVRIYQNGVFVGTATETETPGVFAFTSDTLSDGCYKFTATATDVADNTSNRSCAVEIEVDNTPPASPVFAGLSDPYCCDSDHLTDDSTPTLIIVAEAGSTVNVYRDGVLVGTAVETSKAGKFIFTSTDLADHSYAFTATATDKAGNTSPASDDFAVTVITADPNDFDELADKNCIIFASDGTVYGTAKDDCIRFGYDDDCDPGRTIYTGAGNDNIKGTDRDDVVYAGSGHDKVYGNNGADTIFGGYGHDVLSGGKGNDILVGGYGADVMTGGKGHDSFVFLSAIDSLACQRDLITDFETGCDKIDLAAIDANSGQAGDQAFNFAGQTSAHTVVANSVSWYYDSHTHRTYVVADTDGDITTAEVEIALAGNVTLTEQHFVL